MQRVNTVCLAFGGIGWHFIYSAVLHLDDIPMPLTELCLNNIMFTGVVVCHVTERVHRHR